MSKHVYSLVLMDEVVEAIDRLAYQQLLSELTVFYKLWAALEHQFLLPGMPEGIHYQIEAGRFIRTFRLPPDQAELSTDQIGEYIAGYIRLFDHILKVYFAALPQGQDAALEAATAAYRKLLPKKIVHI